MTVLSLFDQYNRLAIQLMNKLPRTTGGMCPIACHELAHYQGKYGESAGGNAGYVAVMCLIMIKQDAGDAWRYLWGCWECMQWIREEKH